MDAKDNFDAARIARVDVFGRLMLAAAAAFCFISPLLGGARIDFAGSGPVLAMFAVTASIAWVYRPAGRDIPQFAFFGALGAELVAYGLIFGLYSYVVAQSPRPLYDSQLGALDAAIGLDWPAYLATVHARPWLQTTLSLGYYSMMPQIGVLLVILALRKDRARIRLLMSAILFCALICITLSGIFPSVPAYAYHGMLGLDTPVSAGIPFPAYEPFMEMHRIRAGLKTEFSFITTVGIVSFPSFHTAVGVLLAAFAWHIAWLRWPALALNALLVAATPIDGGHYFMDTLAGFGIALAVLWGLRAYVLRQPERRAIAATPGVSLG